MQATEVVPVTATGSHTLSTPDNVRDSSIETEQAGRHAVREAMAVAAALDTEIAHQGKPSAHVTPQSSDEASSIFSASLIDSRK